jgi:hypothetical protein
MMRPVLLLACAVSLFLAILWQMQPREMPSTPTRTRQGDAALFQAIVVDLQHGYSYYEAVGTELRSRNYPVRDLFNWRQPLLLTMIAAISGPVAQMLLIGLGGWLLWLTLTGAPMLTPLLLINALIVVFVRPAVYLSELWAGVCLALSAVALTRRQRPIGIAWAILALSIRELAAPYCVGATLIAVWRRDWREVRRWAMGGGLYAGYYGWHAWQVHTHVQPTDLAHPHSWLALGGPVFLLHALQTAGLWSVLPVPVFALAMVAAVAALWAPRMPVHVRMGVLVYVGFFLIAGQPFNVYWGWMVGPLLALWLAYVPSGFGRLLYWARHQEDVQASGLRSVET